MRYLLLLLIIGVFSGCVKREKDGDIKDIYGYEGIRNREGYRLDITHAITVTWKDQDLIFSGTCPINIYDFKNKSKMNRSVCNTNLRSLTVEDFTRELEKRVQQSIKDLSDEHIASLRRYKTYNEAMETLTKSLAETIEIEGSQLTLEKVKEELSASFNNLADIEKRLSQYVGNPFSINDFLALLEDSDQIANGDKRSVYEPIDLYKYHTGFVFTDVFYRSGALNEGLSLFHLLFADLIKITFVRIADKTADNINLSENGSSGTFYFQEGKIYGNAWSIDRSKLACMISRGYYSGEKTLYFDEFSLNTMSHLATSNFWVTDKDNINYPFQAYIDSKKEHSLSLPYSDTYVPNGSITLSCGQLVMISQEVYRISQMQVITIGDFNTIFGGWANVSKVD